MLLLPVTLNYSQACSVYVNSLAGIEEHGVLEESGFSTILEGKKNCAIAHTKAQAISIAEYIVHTLRKQTHTHCHNRHTLTFSKSCNSVLQHFLHVRRLLVFD